MTLLVFSIPPFAMNRLSFLMTIIGSIYAAFSTCDGQTGVYNVLDYGAISSDFVDNSQAFLGAWNAACHAETGTRMPKVVVPANMSFLVFPLTFQGPCRSEKIIFLVSGKIVAQNSPGLWSWGDASQWLAFKGIRGLTVKGFGTIDGQGKGWWDQSCKINPELEGCTKLSPTALSFLGCNQSRVSDLHFINSPQTHILIMRCHGFRVDKLLIQSPGNSPNTDGIHIQASHHLAITNSIIGSGDDCISVGDYSSNIEISAITCGPGHGISIGSLGKGGNFVRVSKISVTNSLFNGTTNGVRIKTWQVGKGYVRKITFRNLRFINVKNPIIIDQNYCDVRGACKEQETGVKISNVTYSTLFGTSSSKVAINLNCSRSVNCSEILMQAVRLKSTTAGKQVAASCTNAHGQEMDVMPGPCLQNSASTTPMFR